MFGWTVLLALITVAAPASAQGVQLPPITVGAGLQTSFVHTDADIEEEEDDASDAFLLNSVRLYVSGPVTSSIKVMFNTEYNGATNAVGVLDAVAQFEFSPGFNVWFGRFLPPSDRANLYGPYYAHHWSVYTDGVQDGYPFIFQGRDNGAVYWGQFGKVKLSGGAFDGASATGDDTLLGAGRIQVDFWDPEPGYYFPQLTVEENLRSGLGARRGRRVIPPQIYDLFPVLKQMLQRRGGDLSGGQQQQLAIARALVLEPKLLILDEPTEGVQPNIVHDIGNVILTLNREAGLTILLVEQKLPFARRVASHFHVLEKGRRMAGGPIAELTENVVHEYLSV